MIGRKAKLARPSGVLGNIKAHRGHELEKKITASGKTGPKNKSKHIIVRKCIWPCGPEKQLNRYSVLGIYITYSNLLNSHFFIAFLV